MSNCKSFSKDISDVRADVECDTKIFYVTLLHKYDKEIKLIEW